MATVTLQLWLSASSQRFVVAAERLEVPTAAPKGGGSEAGGGDVDAESSSKSYGDASRLHSVNTSTSKPTNQVGRPVARLSAVPNVR